MGMADDDIEFIRANTTLLSDQQSKQFYASGFSAGMGLVDHSLSSYLNSLYILTENLGDILASDYNKDLLEHSYFATRTFQQLSQGLDDVAMVLFKGLRNEAQDHRQQDLVDLWLRSQYQLVRYLVHYPVLFAKVIGCNKRPVNHWLETIAVKGFRKEALNANQEHAYEMMLANDKYKKLSANYVDVLECACSNCRSCCGKGCVCSYEHLDPDELDYECDYDECDIYEHSRCISCESCECC